MAGSLGDQGMAGSLEDQGMAGSLEDQGMAGSLEEETWEDWGTLEAGSFRGFLELAQVGKQVGCLY
jgi:hypothetical protein